MKKQVLAVFGAVIALAALSGCNTVRGVGDDLKSVANAVDDET